MAVVQITVILLQCWLQSKVNVNSALRENSKEHSSSTTSTEASFGDGWNEKTLNINTACQQ